MARKSASFFCRLCCSSSIRRAAGGGTRWPLSSVPSLGLPAPSRPPSPTHCCYRQGALAPRCTRASAAAPDLPHAASACGQGTGSSRLSSGPISFLLVVATAFPASQKCPCRPLCLTPSLGVMCAGPTISSAIRVPTLYTPHQVAPGPALPFVHLSPFHSPLAGPGTIIPCQPSLLSTPQFHSLPSSQASFWNANLL